MNPFMSILGTMIKPKRDALTVTIDKEALTLLRNISNKMNCVGEAAALQRCLSVMDVVTDYIVNDGSVTIIGAKGSVHVQVKETQ